MIALALLLVATDPTNAERLAAGEILVVTNADQAVITTAVIDAPPEKVWAIVWDCGNYKNTMKGIGDSVMVKDDGDVRVCRVTADLPFPLSDLVSTTRSVRAVDPGKQWTRTWKLVEGDYVKNEGQWKVEPYGDGTRTLVTYRLLAIPKMHVPDSLTGLLQKKKLPAMIEHLREQLAPQKKT